MKGPLRRPRGPCMMAASAWRCASVRCGSGMGGRRQESLAEIIGRLQISVLFRNQGIIASAALRGHPMPKAILLTQYSAPAAAMPASDADPGVLRVCYRAPDGGVGIASV